MKKDRLRIQAHVILGGLLVQYLFGMFANLFVAFPDTHNVRTLWDFAQSQWPVTVHMALGAGLVLGGIVLVIRALLKKDKSWIIASLVGLVSLLIAFVGGMQFISTQQDGYSYLMAVAFLVALCSYGWVYIR